MTLVSIIEEINMNKTINHALNNQIHMELESSYLYLALSAYYDSKDLPGFAHWMREQSREEYGHAMRLFDYLLTRGAQVDLDTLGKPADGFTSPVNAFGRVVEHEKRVTKAIHKLYLLALEEGDLATGVELQWFIQEQVEEEKSVSEVAAQLRWGNGDPMGLLMVDRDLAKRE